MHIIYIHIYTICIYIYLIDGKSCGTIDMYAAFEFQYAVKVRRCQILLPDAATTSPFVYWPHGVKVLFNKLLFISTWAHELCAQTETAATAATRNRRTWHLKPTPTPTTKSKSLIPPRRVIKLWLACTHHQLGCVRALVRRLGKRREWVAQVWVWVEGVGALVSRQSVA